MQTLKKICQLYEQRLGFNAQYLSMSSWERAVRSRMAVLGIDNDKSYLHLLINDQKEFQALTELVVVPETWFFRDPEAYQFLIKWAMRHFKQPQSRPLRILCIPCSTGEEPYSVAMTLLSASIPASSFIIEGVDISTELLQIASKGVYGRNSFRSKGDHEINKYFIAKGDRYIISPEVRSCIFFHQGNALDEELFPPHTQFDVIFCRNLLIYLKESSQLQLVSLMKKLLTSDGILFVAPAELETARRYGFRNEGKVEACALKADYTKPIEKKPTLIKKSNHAVRFNLGDIDLFNLPTDDPVDLQIAFNLANEGQFEQAKKSCQAYIKQSPKDPEAYYILGVIEHAMAKSHEAEKNFQKTLYLNPEHHEALVYMGLLAEKDGDVKKARVYKDRAERSLRNIHANSSYDKRG